MKFLKPSLSNYSLEFKDYTQNFKFIRKQKNDNIGEISLMKNKKTNSLVQIKEEIVYSKKDLTDILTSLEELLPLNSQSLFIQFLGFCVKKTQLNIKNNSFIWNIFMIYEYLPQDLEKEMNNKIKTNQLFSEKSLWRSLEEILKGLISLHNIKRNYGNISMNKIYLNENQDLKIFYTNYNITAIEQIKNQEVPYYNCLLSPEQLEYLFSENNQTKPSNETKNEIFTIALLILQMGSLENKERIYNLSSKTLNFEALKRKLSLMRSLYSSIFCDLIAQMLSVDHSIRPTYQEIGYVIHNYSNKLENKKFSTPPSQRKVSKSEQKLKKRENNTSFDSAFLTPSLQNHFFNSEEKILNESKSTKRTDKTAISFPSKEIYYMSNNSNPPKEHNNYFEKLKRSHGKTPEKIRLFPQTSAKKPKYNLLFNSNHHIVSNSQQLIQKKPDLVKITQNVRLLEKQIIIDSSTGLLKPTVSKKIYSDGSIFLGSVKDNKRHGKGIYYFSHYEVYGGDWVDDKFHGKGVYLYDNGDRYEGDLVFGAKQGKGIYYYNNGDKYDGDWDFNMKQGFGIFYYINNERFEGYWANNEKHGKGVYYFLSGDKFEGIWIKGKKNGKGVVYFADKSIFEGIWIDNTPNGMGVLKYGNGDIYQGNFMGGIKEGEGIYKHEIGGEYNGDWKHDERNGKGFHIYPNGDKYTGLVYNGERVGHGEYIYCSGEKYIGEWKGNVRHGKGKLILSEKSYYDGEWKDGKREGFGMMIYENGDKYEGLWSKDKKNGAGFYQWSNGTFYKGEWKEDNMNGEGIYLDESGFEISGIWNENELCE